MLAFAVTYMSKSLVVQIYIIWFQSIIALLILEYVKPFKEKSARINEIFNEVVMMLLLYTFICYSNWGPDSGSKFKIGFISCGLVSLHLLINISKMFITTIKNVFKKCRMNNYNKKHRKYRTSMRKKLKANRNKRRKRNYYLFKKR